MDGDNQLINPNFFAADHIPFSMVLPSTNLMVSTGMSTAYLGCLNYGVPNFVLSSGGSGTDVISQNVLDVGIGIVLPVKKCSVANILRGLNFLLEHEGIKEQVSKLAQRAREFDLVDILCRQPVLSGIFHKRRKK